MKHKLKKKSKTFGGVKPTNRVALTISEDQFVTEELEQIEKSRSTQRAASARERKPKKGTRLLTYSSTLPSNFKLHDAAANLTSGGVSFLERSGAYGGGVTVPMTQTELEFVTMPKWYALPLSQYHQDHSSATFCVVCSMLISPPVHSVQSGPLRQKH